MTNFNASPVLNPRQRTSAFVDKLLLRGNNKDTSAVNVGISCSPAIPKHVEVPTQVYRVALTVNPTRKQKRLFSRYRSEIHHSGWSLVPTKPSGREELAYIAAPYGSLAELSAAKSLVRSSVEEMVRGFSE